MKDILNDISKRFDKLLENAETFTELREGVIAIAHMVSREIDRRDTLSDSTIDELADALDYDLSLIGGGRDEGSLSIIARHIREAVSERDALLRECRHLLWHHGHGEGTRNRIDALIGKDEDEA